MTLYQVLLCFWFGGSIAMAFQIYVMRGIIDHTLPQAIVGALLWPFALFMASRQRARLVKFQNEQLREHGLSELQVPFPPPSRCDPCEKAVQEWNEAFPAIIDCAECRKRFEQWKAEYGVQIDDGFEG